MVLRKPCPCGWVVPAYLDNEAGAAAQRDHVFWHCRPAGAVRALLTHNLPQGAQLRPQHLWLLQPPDGVFAGVWMVVALAALTAIDRARSYMWALHCEQLEERRVVAAAGGRQLTIEQAFRMAPRPAAVQVVASVAAGHRAVAEVLAAVQDFVTLDMLPDESSWGRIGPEHPFIGVRPVANPPNSFELVYTCRVPDAPQ